MRVVLGLGGNAILRHGDAPDVETQRANIAGAARATAEVARAHQVVLTHGNGPQVGQLALEAAGGAFVRSLDELDAETEGLLGYWIEQALRNELPDREIATLLTQVEVSRDDPAFSRPTKPIGPVGARRLVPSPPPIRILEMATIRRLALADVLVVCAGGGGIPVAREPGGRMEGVEAVVDKDRTAALLATELGAAMLVLLTDVDAVYRDWPRRDEPIRKISPGALRGLPLPEGSMGPKAAAACEFVERTGGTAAIGELTEAAALVAGRAGTRVEPRLNS
jgi:carbamate kinase